MLICLVRANHFIKNNKIPNIFIKVRTQPVGESAPAINNTVPECEYNILDKGSGEEEPEKKDVTVSTATLVPGPKPLGLNIDLSAQQGIMFGSGKVVLPAQPSSPPQPPQPPQQPLPNSPPQQPFEVSQVGGNHSDELTAPVLLCLLNYLNSRTLLLATGQRQNQCLRKKERIFGNCSIFSSINWNSSS